MSILLLQSNKHFKLELRGTTYTITDYNKNTLYESEFRCEAIEEFNENYQNLD